MTPKEKAEKLTSKFKPFVQFKMGVEQSYVTRMAKQCALVTVDEIFNSINGFNFSMNYILIIDYWLEVKQEIEKL